MKKLLIALVLMSIVIGICIFEMFSIDHISSESIETINIMQQAHENNDKYKLKELSENLYNLWEGKTQIMHIFFQHDSVDEIEQSIAIIKNSIDQDDDETFQTESTRVAIQIQSLRDSEFPYIENIL